MPRSRRCDGVRAGGRARGVGGWSRGHRRWTRRRAAQPRADAPSRSAHRGGWCGIGQKGSPRRAGPSASASLRRPFEALYCVAPPGARLGPRPCRGSSRPHSVRPRRVHSSVGGAVPMPLRRPFEALTSLRSVRASPQSSPASASVRDARSAARSMNSWGSSSISPACTPHRCA